MHGYNRGLVKGQSIHVGRETICEGELRDPRDLLLIMRDRAIRAVNWGISPSGFVVGVSMAAFTPPRPRARNDDGGYDKAVPGYTKILSGANHTIKPENGGFKGQKYRRVCGEQAAALAAEEGDIFLGAVMLACNDPELVDGNRKSLEGLRLDRQITALCFPCFDWLGPKVSPETAVSGVNLANGEFFGMALGDMGGMYDSTISHPEFFTGSDAEELVIEALKKTATNADFNRLGSPPRFHNLSEAT